MTSTSIVQGSDDVRSTSRHLHSWQVSEDRVLSTTAVSAEVLLWRDPGALCGGRT